MSRKGWRSPLVALRVAGSSLILVLYSWLFLLPSSREASVLDLLPGLQLFPALERLAVAPSLRLAAGAGLGAIVVIIVMLLATLTLGRVYCSFLCPLGAFQDGLVALRRAFPGKRARFFRYRPGRPLVHAAAFSLVAVAALAGLPLLLGLVEPWAAFGKLASAVLRPAAALANNVAAALARAFGSWDLAPGPIPWEPVQGFEGIMICLALFALVMTRGRIFCNLLCPTGAILRFLSSKPLFRLRVDKGSCTACGACSRACRASCISEPERGAAEAPAIDEARCIRCFDCVAVCPSRSIAFSAKALAAARIPRGPAAGARAAGARAADAGAADAGRRSFLRSATNWSGVAAFLLAGGAGFVASRIGRAAGPARAAGSADDAGDAGASPWRGPARGRLRPAGRLVRGRALMAAAPPGAGTVAAFLAACTACGACVARCPSLVLRPSLSEWGLADAGKPFLDHGRAYCQFECDLCFGVCPTGALLPISREDKKQSRLGRSLLALDLCIVKTKKTNCGACAEHCPSGALTMVRPAPGPGAGSLPEPVIDEDYCIGCGACETVCPSKPDKAILVEGRAVQDRAKLRDRRPGDKGDVQAAPGAPAGPGASGPGGDASPGEGGTADPSEAPDPPVAEGFPF